MQRCVILQSTGMAPGRPEESERRPVIIGGGGRRPGSSGSLPSAPSAARLRVDDLSPTTPQQAEMQEDDLTTRTLNQVLDPFLDGERTCSTREQQVLLLQRFLKAVPDPLKRWNGPTGPLIAVSRAGRADLARLLLRSSASANDSDAKGVTALHIAVFDGNAELCKVLLNSKADVDAADRHRQTPLFFAPSKEICRLLVERRAEAGVLNRKGQSALHLAGRAGFHDVLSWLSSRVGKPIVELRDHHGNTAQMYVQQALAASLAQAPHGEDQVGATVVEAAGNAPEFFATVARCLRLLLVSHSHQPCMQLELHKLRIKSSTSSRSQKNIRLPQEPIQHPLQGIVGKTIAMEAWSNLAKVFPQFPLIRSRPLLLLQQLGQQMA
ncbi:unnamed protein product [Durusdinium trenchii]|uniref:Uncharacterized protein n=1 Tax=Durusdinium trenchii TaxID=1381693 RepID=A0ABP0HD55_9DINO